MGETAQFYYELELLEDIEVPIGGLVITNHHNITIHGKNSAQALLPAPPAVSRSQRVRFCQTIRLSLAPGQYTYSLGFSTLPAEDYARLPHLSYAHFDQLAKVLLVVQQAGSFQVVLSRDPSKMDFPFHGVTDLKGVIPNGTDRLNGKSPYSPWPFLLVREFPAHSFFTRLLLLPGLSKLGIGRKP